VRPANSARCRDVLAAFAPKVPMDQFGTFGLLTGPSMTYLSSGQKKGLPHWPGGCRSPDRWVSGAVAAGSPPALPLPPCPARPVSADHVRRGQDVRSSCLRATPTAPRSPPSAVATPPLVFSGPSDAFPKRS
jgi:hypothetical protein